MRESPTESISSLTWKQYRDYHDVKHFPISPWAFDALLDTVSKMQPSETQGTPKKKPEKWVEIDLNSTTLYALQEGQTMLQNHLSHELVNCWTYS